MRHSKNGSAMVEASLVFPMIIAAVVLFIAAAVYMYGLAAGVSDLNRSVRRASGESAGTVMYGDELISGSGGFHVSSSEKPEGVKCTAEFTDAFDHFYIFSADKDHAFKAGSDGVREAAVILDKQAAENVYEAIVE